MKLVKIFSFIVILSSVLFGQTNKGGITGTVTDSKGAVVPGVTVTITNVGTNKSIVVTTSDEGSFTVSTLDPVVYEIKI